MIIDEIFLKYTNYESRFVAIDKTLIHYRDEGSGTPILLLHGAFSSLHTFEAWTVALKKHFRVLRLDLLGFGLTGRHSRDDYSIKSHVYILHEFLEALHIEECVLCGNSFGGWLAWEFAVKYPKRVSKLILCAAAGFLEPDSVPLPFLMARTPFINRVIRMVVRRNLIEQFLKQVYSDSEQVKDTLIDRYFDLFGREGNPEAFLLMVNKTVFRDDTIRLKDIKAPTLILWGEDDPWIPLNYAHQFLQSIPNARLVIYEGVGHLPMEEAPKTTVKEIKQFMLEN